MAEILEAGETAMVGRGQVRLHIIESQIEADVAVEIEVARVAGITLGAAPDLARGFKVAYEGGDAVRGKDGREHSVTRTRFGMEQPMGVHRKPVEIRLLQNGF